MKNRIFALLVSFCLFASVINAPAVNAADLIVNFAMPLGPAKRQATGFEWIFPMNAAAMKPFIAPLKPNVIKDPWGNQQVALDDMNATKVQWLVGNAVVQGHQFIPWQDWNRWKTYVRNYVTSLTPNNEKYEWIIWQEPDSTNPDIWQGTREQFFETWKYAVEEIRKARPDDIIIGPSPEQFNEYFLKSFLDYAKANNVLPDVLSWHELSDIGPAGYTPDLIPSHVNTIKAYVQGIAATTVKRFEITEYQGYTDDYRPGPAAAFITDLEVARISGTKGNWGKNNDPTQISGLVTDPDNPKPRSIWWVYRKYADMSGTLYDRSFSSSLNGLGSYDETTKIIRILAGNQGGAGSKTVSIENLPQPLSGGKTVNVKIEYIPNTELAQLDNPQVLSDSKVVINGNSYQTPVFNLGPWDAVFITVSSASLPGDLNNSSHVDIFDYNLLVSNFGNPYTIFDYNTLISNFGK